MKDIKLQNTFCEKCRKELVTDKVQVEAKELSEIIAKVHDCAEGRYELTGQDCYEIQSLLCQLQDGTIKQLQSRIDELEEHRERLIAKLMNAYDKIKESN